MRFEFKPGSGASARCQGRLSHVAAKTLTYSVPFKVCRRFHNNRVLRFEPRGTGYEQTSVGSDLNNPYGVVRKQSDQAIIVGSAG
jgi:hypothetical protein